jgi:hypothetical protein
MFSLSLSGFVIRITAVQAAASWVSFIPSMFRITYAKCRDFRQFFPGITYNESPLWIRNAEFIFDAAPCERQYAVKKSIPPLRNSFLAEVYTISLNKFWENKTRLQGINRSKGHFLQAVIEVLPPYSFPIYLRELHWIMSSQRFLKLLWLTYMDKSLLLVIHSESNACSYQIWGVTYLLNPWSRVLLEKLTGSQLVKNFPAFYGNRKFITAFTRARHLSLPWASSIQFIPPHPTSWKSILIW